MKLCFEDIGLTSLRRDTRSPSPTGTNADAEHLIGDLVPACTCPSRHRAGSTLTPWLWRAAVIAGAVVFVLSSYGIALAKCKDRAQPGVDWQRCNMQMTILEEVDLTRANLSGAFLSGTVFDGSKLTEADLQLTELVRTSFKNAELSGANFEKSLSSRSLFTSAILRSARLVKAEFHRVSFVQADLTGADMTEGDFIRNDFTGALLDGVNLRGATLPRSIFREASLENTSFKGAYLYWARFERTDLRLARDLTQEQLDIACGDESTTLPAGVTVPRHWPCGD